MLSLQLFAIIKALIRKSVRGMASLLQIVQIESELVECLIIPASNVVE